MVQTFFDEGKKKNSPLIVAAIFILLLGFSLSSCQQQPTPASGEAMTSPKDGMITLYVPAGEFTMGSTEDDSMAKDHEFPQHQVYLDAFWIDQTEVTNAMFSNFLNEVGNQNEDGSAWINTIGHYSTIRQEETLWIPEDGYENHPVANITWYAAEAYCEWAGRRLPTEAEWEKAARGTDGNIYPWGNDEPTCEITNYDYYCWVRHSKPVGSYPNGQSPYGALDMSGNAWEMVADYYAADYYMNSPQSNPTGPTTGDSRVVRGGSFHIHEYDVRTTRRSKVLPTGSGAAVGFRCALSAEN